VIYFNLCVFYFIEIGDAMNKFLLFIFFLFAELSFAQIWAPEGLNMPGGWNSWTNPPSNALALACSAQTAGGTLSVQAIGQRRYHTTLHAGSDGVSAGTNEWLFTSGPSSSPWNNKWGGVTVAINSIQTYYIGGSNNSANLTSGHYYTVNWKDLGYQNSEAIFMETASAPVSISSVTDKTWGTGQNDTVVITTSGTPSDEKLFLRFTTDNWASHHLVQAAGSGTTWKAIIPGTYVADTSSNSYYVLSSTVALSDTMQGYRIDLYTINFLNNANTNYPFLPVELTTFTASTTSKGVELRWTTATEKNNAGFNVERSSDKSSWSIVKFVNGSGTSNSPKNYYYLDNNVSAGTNYYRLKQIDNDGTSKYYQIIETAGITPSQYELFQNYPNPFNPTTKISFSLVKPGMVTLTVYNAIGQKVYSFTNSYSSAGIYDVEFNGANLPSGIYYYKLEADGFDQVKKMTLVK
jgi:hypothetical protein